MPFVKLDCNILDSTLWFDRDGRDVFVTALLMAEPVELTNPAPEVSIDDTSYTGWAAPPGWYGFVPAAGTAIVRRAGIDQEEGYAALRRLAAPDPESRTPDYDGRRMIRTDGGFLILNYNKYRERDYTAAERSARYREKKRNAQESAARHAVSSASHAVISRSVTQAEAEAEAEAEVEVEKRAGERGASAPPHASGKTSNGNGAKRFTPPSLEEVEAWVKEKHPDWLRDRVFNPAKFITHYVGNGWKVGKVPMKNWKATASNWVISEDERRT
jgi:hypothetical protein